MPTEMKRKPFSKEFAHAARAEQEDAEGDVVFLRSSSHSATRQG